MGSKYPVLPPDKIVSALRKIGFEKISQKGSHLKLIKKGSPKYTCIVPMHNEVAKGTLKSILEQSGITLEEFTELL